MTNEVTSNPKEALNAMVLFIKKYLHNAFCKDETPTWNSSYHYVCNWIKTEKYVALKNGKILIHQKEWQDYTDMLNGEGSRCQDLPAMGT